MFCLGRRSSQPAAPGGAEESVYDTCEMVGVNLEPPAVTAATV